MTAGQIAYELGGRDVTINYRCSEGLVGMDKPGGLFGQDPMPCLEYSKAGCDFKRMQRENPLYQTVEYFPSDVDFREPPNPCDFDVVE